MDSWIINNETGRIEFLDARFYRDSRTGLMVPSVTTLLEAWPKGAAYYEWLKRNGQDADEIRDEAGRRGSVVHNLTESLDRGNEVFMCNDDGSPRYKMSEWAMLERYVEFRKRICPRIMETETNLIDTELGYAGTLDRVVEIKNDIWIIDIKTSAAVYDHYELQLIAYWNLLRKIKKLPDASALNIRLGILWLNAKTRTEGKGEMIQGKGWQLVEVANSKERLLDLWEACRTMWHAVNLNVKPRELSYALSHKVETSTLQTIEQ
jgi:hypothetical protein